MTAVKMAVLFDGVSARLYTEYALLTRAYQADIQGYTKPFLELSGMRLKH